MCPFLRHAKQRPLDFTNRTLSSTVLSRIICNLPNYVLRRTWSTRPSLTVYDYLLFLPLHWLFWTPFRAELFLVVLRFACRPSSILAVVVFLWLLLMRKNGMICIWWRFLREVHEIIECVFILFSFSPFRLLSPFVAVKDRQSCC